MRASSTHEVVDVARLQCSPRALVERRRRRNPQEQKQNAHSTFVPSSSGETCAATQQLRTTRVGGGSSSRWVSALSADEMDLSGLSVRWSWSRTLLLVALVSSVLIASLRFAKWDGHTVHRGGQVCAGGSLCHCERNHPHSRRPWPLHPAELDWSKLLDPAQLFRRALTRGQF